MEFYDILVSKKFILEVLDMEKWERDFLRDMARKKLELSQSDWMQSRIRAWAVCTAVRRNLL